MNITTCRVEKINQLKKAYVYNIHVLIREFAGTVSRPACSDAMVVARRGADKSLPQLNLPV